MLAPPVSTLECLAKQTNPGSLNGMYGKEIDLAQAKLEHCGKEEGENVYKENWFHFLGASRDHVSCLRRSGAQSLFPSVEKCC